MWNLHPPPASPQRIDKENPWQLLEAGVGEMDEGA